MNVTSTQAYTTRDDTLEATTDLGIEINDATSELLNRTGNSVDQSAVDTTAGTGPSKTPRIFTQDSEGETTINEHPQATRKSDAASDYPLEGTQAWVEAQVNNVTITAHDESSTAHLQAETNEATTLTYFTAEGSSTRPQDRNTAGMLHFTCARSKIISRECITSKVIHRKSESNFS